MAMLRMKVMARVDAGDACRGRGQGRRRPKHGIFLTTKAVVCLCRLLSLIEEGRPWPRDVLCIKAAFIAKPSTRVDELTDWATPDMFAIMEGTGAAMGAFRSAVIRERATLQGALLRVL